MTDTSIGRDVFNCASGFCKKANYCVYPNNCIAPLTAALPHLTTTEKPGERGATTWPYQKTFNAIAAAVHIEAGHIAISVKAFGQSFGPPPTEKPVSGLTEANRYLTAEIFKKVEDDNIGVPLGSLKMHLLYARAIIDRLTGSANNGEQA